MHTCLHAYMPRSLEAYMHTYIRAYVHTCIKNKPPATVGTVCLAYINSSPSSLPATEHLLQPSPSTTTPPHHQKREESKQQQARTSLPPPTLAGKLRRQKGLWPFNPLQNYKNHLLSDKDPCGWPMKRFLYFFFFLYRESLKQ